jgi:hypothetical protein
MTVNGEDLAVVIRCKYLFSHDWMTFAAWYSLSKMLPDAAVYLSLDKSARTTRQVFSWVPRVGIKLSSAIDDNLSKIHIDCDTLMVRELTEEQAEAISASQGGEIPPELISEAKDDQYTPFVSYRKGCGNFVESEWIDTTECPFSWADRFMTHSANANEVRILKLWKQLTSIYATVSRG